MGCARMTIELISTMLFGAIAGAVTMFIGLSRRLRRAGQLAETELVAVLLDLARELPNTFRELQLKPARERGVAELPQLAGPSDDVQAALKTMSRSTLELVQEQWLLRMGLTDMWVHLARRSENLVQRQLHIIEPLELDEANEHILGELFQLDHLMTRLRRVNANAMVLAGSAGMPVYGAPLEVPDVLYGALAGAEQYQRVTVSTQVNCAVTGGVSDDLIPLITELVDNAATFSAPATEVMLTSDFGTSGPLRIQVTDQGLGIAEQDLRKLNTQLQTVGASQFLGARRVGLLVVGRLAGRHGITVKLQKSPTGQGTVAHIEVPRRHLFQDGTALTAPQPGGDRTPAHVLDNLSAEPAHVIDDATAAGHRFRTTPARAPEPVPLPTRPSSHSAIPAPAATAPPAITAGPASNHGNITVPDDPLPAPASGPVPWKDQSIGRPEQRQSPWFTHNSGVGLTREPGGSELASGAVDESGTTRDNVTGEAASRPDWGASGPDWGAPAEDGWCIVQSASSPVRSADPLTGLPIRTRGARLFYGSAPTRSRPSAPEAAGPATAPREPLVIRNRLSAYRRGVGQANQENGRVTVPGKRDAGWTVLIDDP